MVLGKAVSCGIKHCEGYSVEELSDCEALGAVERNFCLFVMENFKFFDSVFLEGERGVVSRPVQLLLFWISCQFWDQG